MKVYIDFDSCYYNIARRVFGIAPWTVITNRFNHIISAPHWLEGHFGVKKIDYLAPAVRVKLKVKRLVEVLNIDAIPDGRNTMTEFLAGVLEDVKVFAPDASVVHKDSIMVEINRLDISKLKKVVRIPCVVGVGSSEEEAKNDCKMKKIAKRRSPINTVTLILYFIPMVVSYLLRLRYFKEETK